MSFNFMAAVTICCDSGAQENKICHSFHCFPFYLPCSNLSVYHDLTFFFFNVEFQASFCTFTFIKRLLSSSSLSAIRVALSTYLKLLIFLLAFLTPAYDSSSLAFCTMNSAYKFKKHDNNLVAIFS